MFFFLAVLELNKFVTSVHPNSCHSYSVHVTWYSLAPNLSTLTAIKIIEELLGLAD